MSNFTSPGIIVTKESDGTNLWRLNETLEFYIDVPGGNTVIVPKGFRTDFASVPRIFWGIFPPATGRYIRAAVVHDYLTTGGVIVDKRIKYDDGKTVNFKTANKIFLNAMKASGVNSVQRYILFFSVETYRILTGQD